MRTSTAATLALSFLLLFMASTEVASPAVETLKMSISDGVISVTGQRPGSTIGLLVVGSRPLGFSVERVNTFLIAEDAVRAGAVSFDVKSWLPTRVLLVAIDLESGAYASLGDGHAAVPVGVERVLRGAIGEALEFSRRGAFVLYVRPNKGFWAGVALARPDGKTMRNRIAISALRGKSDDERLTKPLRGDLVIVVDRNSLEFVVNEVTN